MHDAYQCDRLPHPNNAVRTAILPYYVYNILSGIEEDGKVTSLAVRVPRNAHIFTDPNREGACGGGHQIMRQNSKYIHFWSYSALNGFI